MERRRVDAEAWETEQRAALLDGSWTDPARGRATVAELAGRWLDHGVAHLKPKTVAGYESILGQHIVPAVGLVPIGRLDRAQIRNLVGGMLADGAAPGTARNALNTLSALCRFAIDSGAIKSNPCTGIKTPRSRRTRRGF